MSQPEQPLSAALLERADQARRLAHLLTDAVPEAAQALVFQAATLGLLHLRAERLERELAQARRTVAEMHAQAAEEADAAEARARAADPARAERWHGHARTIAAILTPVLRHPGQPNAPDARP